MRVITPQFESFVRSVSCDISSSGIILDSTVYCPPDSDSPITFADYAAALYCLGGFVGYIHQYGDTGFNINLVYPRTLTYRLKFNWLGTGFEYGLAVCAASDDDDIVCITPYTLRKGDFTWKMNRADEIATFNCTYADGIFHEVDLNYLEFGELAVYHGKINSIHQSYRVHRFPIWLDKSVWERFFPMEEYPIFENRFLVKPWLIIFHLFNAGPLVWVYNLRTRIFRYAGFFDEDLRYKVEDFFVFDTPITPANNNNNLPYNNTFIDDKGVHLRFEVSEDSLTIYRAVVPDTFAPWLNAAHFEKLSFPLTQAVRKSI